MNYIINTDGASRGNPGPASYGFVVTDQQGQMIHQEGAYLGINTNNFAEYQAIVHALGYIEKYLAKEQKISITIKMDSELAMRQLTGRYKVKHPALKPLFLKIKELEQKFDAVTYLHVPRAQNFLADRIANIALDEQGL